MDSKEIEDKRTKSLVGVFLTMVKLGYIDGTRFTLNRSLLKSVVKHYVQDLMILNIRYRIKGKAQPQKSAGLTAAALLRFRPILPKNPSDEDLFQQEANEALAIFNGLCVCSELGNGKIDLQFVDKFLSLPESPEWISNFRFLLKHRNYTPESLTMVFDTLVKYAK